MNLPKVFRFDYQKDTEIYYASVVGEKVFVDWNNNPGKPTEWHREEVEEAINSGIWVIIEEKYEPIGNYESIGTKIGQLVDRKNAQYGDAFNKSGDYLKILYPNGIQPHQYRDMLALVRDFDKSMRIANGNQGEENAWMDKTGYGILMSEVDGE